MILHDYNYNDDRYQSIIIIIIIIMLMLLITLVVYVGLRVAFTSGIEWTQFHSGIHGYGTWWPSSSEILVTPLLVVVKKDLTSTPPPRMSLRLRLRWLFSEVIWNHISSNLPSLSLHLRSVICRYNVSLTLILPPLGRSGLMLLHRKWRQRKSKIPGFNDLEWPLTCVRGHAPDAMLLHHAHTSNGRAKK